MSNKAVLLLTFASLVLLSSCSGGSSQPVSSNGPGDGPLKVDVSQQPGVSKYSPRQSYQQGGSGQNDWIRNPTKDLPSQSLYTTSNSRWHLIDHFIANEPPQFIPLTSWKYDFIAGELALDAMDLAEAKKMFELSLTESAKEKEPISSQQKALSQARLGFVARLMKDNERAESLLKESLSKLESAAAEDNYERAALISLYELAFMNVAKGDLSASEGWLSKRVALSEKYHGNISPAISSQLNELGNILFYQKKFVEAEKVYLRALLIATRFTKDSDHRIMAYYNLANCFYAEGKFADALECYQRTNDTRQATAAKMQECRDKISKLPEAERKAKTLPPVLGDQMVWKQLLDSAQVQASFEKTWEAKKTLEAAQEEAKVIGASSPELALTQIRLADLLFGDGNYDEAGKLYQDVLNSQKANSKSKQQVAEALSRIMLCQLYRNDNSAAKASLNELKSNSTSDTWSGLVSVLEQCNEKRMFNFDNNEESRAVLSSICQECLARIPNQNTMLRALATANLARAVGRADDDKCATIFKQALLIAEKSSDKNALKMYRLQMNAGTYLMAAQQFSEAEKCFKAALAYAELNPGKENRQLLATIELSRALYSNWKRPEKEEMLLRKKMEITGAEPRTAEATAEEQRTSRLELARIARAKGDLDKAAAYLEEAIKAGRRDPNNAPSEARDLITIYAQTGNWAKAQYWSEAMAKMLPIQSGQQYDQESYNAAVYAAKAGDYEGASKLAQVVIADMESRKETRVQDFGCYQSTPSYPDAVRLLGNCTMDGASNYDKAFSIYSKEIKSLQPDASGNSVEPGGDRRPREEVDVDRPQSMPGRRALNQIGGPSQRLHLSAEQLVNFVICCDAIGNKKVADEHRAQLKARLDDAISRQGRVATAAGTAEAATSQYYEPCIALLQKDKRSKDEEIRLMSLVPCVINPPNLYSGNVEGQALMVRVIAWRSTKGETARKDLSKDYDNLIAMLVSNRRFDEALPYSARKIALLKDSNAGKMELADAIIESAKLDQEQGSFALASKKYIQNLPELKGDKKKTFELSKNLSYCLQMQEDYDEAIRYLKDVSSSAVSVAEKNDLHVRLGTLFDITGDASKASAEYKLIVPDAKDNYTVYEPLRSASDFQAQLKHFQVADSLYRRQAALLGNAPSNALGISNAYSQLARMYKYARKFDKAKEGYELAIKALKTNPADSSCQSQIQTMQREMTDMK